MSKQTVAVLAGVALLLLAVYELLVTGMMHDRRRDERTRDFYSQSTNIGPGDAVAILQAAKIGLNTVIGEGTSPSVLRGGPGHLPTSPLPGEQGNVVLLGHRRRFGGTFENLAELASGDEVVVLPRGGVAIRYRVDEVSTVSKSEAEELAGAASGNRLTMVTSAGGLVSTQRVVVTATQDDDIALIAGRSTNASEQKPVLEGIDSGDLARAFLWSASVGILIYLIARLRDRGHYSVAAVALALPPLGFSFLQLMLALDSLVPSTL